LVNWSKCFVCTGPKNNAVCPSSSLTLAELTAPAGSIMSPNYPGNYDNNAAYGWRVIAGSADMVRDQSET
jgi:hypothetical protein